MKGLYVGSLHKGRVTEFVGGFGLKFKLQGLNNKKARLIVFVTERRRKQPSKLTMWVNMYLKERWSVYVFLRGVLAHYRASKYSVIVDPDGESALTGDLILSRLISPPRCSSYSQGDVMNGHKPDVMSSASFSNEINQQSSHLSPAV